MAQEKLNSTSSKNSCKVDPMVTVTKRKGKKMATIELATQGLGRYMYNLTKKAFMTNSST